MRLVLLLILAGCATKPPLPRNPLIDQILEAIPGEPGLTNTAEVICPDKKPCLEKKLYDLKDPKIRGMLHEFQFVCRIGGKRYSVSKTWPGFYRNEGCSGFLWNRKCVEFYLDIEKNFDFIVEGRATCFSQLRRDWDELD